MQQSSANNEHATTNELSDLCPTLNK